MYNIDLDVTSQMTSPTVTSVDGVARRRQLIAPRGPPSQTSRVGTAPVKRSTNVNGRLEKKDSEIDAGNMREI